MQLEFLRHIWWLHSVSNQMTGTALAVIEVQQVLSMVYRSTSTGLYRSCTALAGFSGTFALFLFQAVNFEFIIEKVWFGMVWIDGLNKKEKKMFLVCFV